MASAWRDAPSPEPDAITAESGADFALGRTVAELAAVSGRAAGAAKAEFPPPDW